jgi:hypothetical protein
MATQQQQSVNDNLVLICGPSATGKSASLMNLDNPEGVLYLNCEAGKKLPFKAKFIQKTITDPQQIMEGLDWAETQPNIHTVVIDTLTYLLDMYESLYVLNSTNGMVAWGNFAQYFKNLMQQYVARSTKNIIFLAHTAHTHNEAEMIMETKVPVKGSLKNNGIESYFSLVIATKKVPLKSLKDYGSPLLVITPEEEALGFKYVFQTKLTKDTVNERLRGPLGLFTTKETFIDNNAQSILNRLHEYYD